MSGTETRRSRRGREVEKELIALKMVKEGSDSERIKFVTRIDCILDAGGSRHQSSNAVSSSTTSQHTSLHPTPSTGHPNPRDHRDIREREQCKCEWRKPTWIGVAREDEMVMAGDHHTCSDSSTASYVLSRIHISTMLGDPTQHEYERL